MSKIAVIGAGASGIVASLSIPKNNEVYLLDGNDKCGKKILLTGSGKCNYWNSNINVDNYYTDNKETLSNILMEENKNKTYEFLEALGIYPKVKNGLFYPYSNTSTSIREIFEKAIINSNIHFKPSFKVKNIIKEENDFVIESIDGKTLKVNKIILATGSKAYPKTGSDGSGYDLVKSLGHKINKVNPALVPLITNDTSFKECDNIRCDAKVTLFVDDEKVKEEMGELQFVQNGLSGICIFNLSSLVSKSLDNKKDVKVKINFAPFTNNFYEWFNERNKRLDNKTLEEQLESIFNYRLMFAILKKACLSRDSRWNNLNEKEKLNFCKVVEEFTVQVTGTQGFEKGQVCTGGISLNDINSSNMESKVVPNLYLAGEILDVDGLCGGFNIAFAFITGYLAGSGIHD